MVAQLERRVARLEREARLWRVCAFLAVVAVAVAAGAGASSGPQDHIVAKSVTCGALHVQQDDGTEQVCLQAQPGRGGYVDLRDADGKIRMQLIAMRNDTSFVLWKDLEKGKSAAAIKYDDVLGPSILLTPDGRKAWSAP
jgi:hypothetical protein